MTAPFARFDVLLLGAGYMASYLILAISNSHHFRLTLITMRNVRELILIPVILLCHYKPVLQLCIDIAGNNLVVLLTVVLLSCIEFGVVHLCKIIVIMHCNLNNVHLTFYC